MARPGTLLLAAVATLAGLALLATPAQAIQLAPEEPHSPNAESIELAYWVMIGLAVALLVGINLVLLAAVARFRDRRGRRPSRFAAGRGALRPVLGVLAALAIAVFTFGVVVTEEVRDVEASGPDGLDSTRSAQVGVKSVPADPAPLEINAIAQQWLWRFEYPGGEPGQRTFSYGELVVPVDTAVILNIDSTDVIHSWWVPSLGGQVQAVPGSLPRTWFKADEEGRYAGRSTIFSGSAYPVMRSWVRVVSATEYEDYVSQLEADLGEAQDIVAEEQAGEAGGP
ncbi:MAG: cytochrome c oxidase subunit II [Solirubrobacterales bacterium]